MDSMRSLNRSLPSTPSSRPAPPEQLLQAFKQAALSVTTLYKSAANDHEQIRQTGYQDALDDLLQFLDRENLGLQDGEGWKVRQWATARYDGSPNMQQSESEDEAIESVQRPRSPSLVRTVEQEEPQTVRESASAPPDTIHHDTATQDQSQGPFQFSAGGDNMQTDESQSSSAENRASPQLLRVEVTNRANRNAHRLNTRHNTRSLTRTPSSVAGSKRKLPFPDISEIFNVGFDKKDGNDGGLSGGGGSKRNRLV